MVLYNLILVTSIVVCLVAAVELYGHRAVGPVPARLTPTLPANTAAAIQTPAIRDLYI